METSLAASYEVIDRPTLRPGNFTPQNWSMRNKYLCPKTLIQIFIVALFKIAPNWKQYECSNNGQSNMDNYIMDNQMENKSIKTIG